MKKLILASGSPRRKELLASANIPFTVMVSRADESAKATKPSQMVKELSYKKANAVWETIDFPKNDILILGADTIVCLGGRILGKPKDENDAFYMLSELSDNTHQVYTGVTLLGENISISFYEKTDVTFGPIPRKDILSYIATGSPMDKAGAYGIQDDFGKKYVKKIDGDYENIVGLPIKRVIEELQGMNF